MKINELLGSGELRAVVTQEELDSIIKEVGRGKIQRDWIYIRSYNGLKFRNNNFPRRAVCTSYDPGEGRLPWRGTWKKNYIGRREVLLQIAPHIIVRLVVHQGNWG